MLIVGARPAAAFAGIKIRVGDKNNLLLNPLLTHKINICWNDFTKHEVTQQLRLLSPFTSDISPQKPQFKCEKKAETELLKKHNLLNTKYIVMHPSYGKGNRAWPPEKYAQLINLLLTQSPYKVVLTGTKKDLEISDQIETNTPQKPINLVGHTNLPELFYLIKNAILVLGAETGPLHMAAMLNRPIVSISPTKYTRSFRWGPFSTHHIVVKQNAQCPLVCNTYKTECTESYCLDPIQVQEVYQSIEFLMNHDTFPKNQWRYWIQTNATFAIQINNLNKPQLDQIKNLVSLMENEKINYVITSTNTSIKKELLTHFKNVQVASMFNIKFWVNTLASHTITVWHFTKKENRLWATLIQHLVSLKIDLKPLTIYDTLNHNDIQSLLTTYRQAFKALSQEP